MHYEVSSLLCPIVKKNASFPFVSVALFLSAKVRQVNFVANSIVFIVDCGLAVLSLVLDCGDICIEPHSQL